MNLLKKIYTEGDDEMKRTLNKAWTESQDKEKRRGDMMDFWTAADVILKEISQWINKSMLCL